MHVNFCLSIRIHLLYRTVAAAAATSSRHEQLITKEFIRTYYQANFQKSKSDSPTLKRTPSNTDQMLPCRSMQDALAKCCVNGRRSSQDTAAKCYVNLSRSTQDTAAKCYVSLSRSAQDTAAKCYVSLSKSTQDTTMRRVM